MTEDGDVVSPDEGLLKWITRYSFQNYWKVAAWMGIEDLIQDGHYWIAYCRDRYRPKTIEHLTSLTMRCFSNHIIDLANKKTALAETRTPEEWVPNFANYDLDESDIQTLAVLIAQAPREITAVLKLLLTEKGLEGLRGEHQIKNQVKPGQLRQRETTNEKVCRLAGLDSSIDIEGMFRRYLFPT